ELWGLLVCHHDDPRHIRHELRATCEVLGSFLSQRLAELSRAEMAAKIGRMREVAAELAAPDLRISAEDPRIIRSLEAALHLLRSSALAVRTVSGTIAVGKPID